MHRLYRAISAPFGFEEVMEVYTALQTCGRPDRPSIDTGCPCRCTTSSLSRQALGGIDGRVADKMAGVGTTMGGEEKGDRQDASSKLTAIKINSVIACTVNV